MLSRALVPLELPQATEFRPPACIAGAPAGMSPFMVSVFSESCAVAGLMDPDRRPVPWRRWIDRGPGCHLYKLQFPEARIAGDPLTNPALPMSSVPFTSIPSRSTTTIRREDE